MGKLPYNDIVFPFGIDPTTGDYGYIKAGADTVTPFKSGDGYTGYGYAYTYSASSRWLPGYLPDDTYFSLNGSNFTAKQKMKVTSVYSASTTYGGGKSYARVYINGNIVAQVGQSNAIREDTLNEGDWIGYYMLNGGNLCSSFCFMVYAPA